MSRAWALLLAAALGGCATAPAIAPSAALPPGEPIALLNPSFEPDAQNRIGAWAAVEHNTGKSYSFVAERQKPLSPPASARISRHGPEPFGILEQRVRVKPEWVGRTVRLSGFLKTAGATGAGGALVLQARNGSDGVMLHDHMDGRRVRGDQDWKQYAVEMKIPPGAWALMVGVMLEDDGTLWADDLALHLMP